MAADPPDLHPDVEPLAFLVGTWRGEGLGEYPTIEPFRYGEELSFEHVGDAYLTYMQRSWLLDDGSPVHLERGFLRPGTEGALELTLAHPLGLTEVSEGTLDGTSFELATIAGGIGRTTTGLAVTGLSRRYRVDGPTLAYELDMATEDTAMTRHLAAVLRREP
ncbi:MAG: FABP family protein [Actinomycetota bacterium]